MNGIIFFVCWKFMNFPMCSCNHFLWNRKQSTMSKMAQERRAGEGPAEAKPRSACLVSRIFLSTKQTSSVDSGASCSLVNQEFCRNSVSGDTGKPVKDSSQDPTTHSQEWQQDDNLIRGARKLAQSGECESSGSTGKSVRGIDNKLERTRLEHHNMQISEYRYVERVFKNLRPLLNRSQNVQMLDLKTYVLIWGLFLSTTMKASSSLEIDLGNTNSRFWTFPRLSGHFLPGWDPLCQTTQWSSGRKQKYTSTQIQFYVGKMYERTEANAKIGNINSQTFISPTLTENYLESMEKRLSLSGMFSQDSATLEILQKMHIILDDRQINPELFEVRIIFMSMSNDIDWTKERKFKSMSVEFRKVQEPRKKVSAWTLVIPRRRRRGQMVWNAHLQTWRKMEYHCGWHGSQRDGVLKACHEQAVVDPRGSRSCMCTITLSSAKWHTQGRKGELTSCRGTVQSVWWSTSSQTHWRGGE